MGKNGLPHITDRFTDDTERKINGGELERTEPPKATLSIGNAYKLNINGQVIGQNGSPLKAIFRKGKRAPFVIISLKRKCAKGAVNPKAKELRLDNLMEKYFGPYIEGYSRMKSDNVGKYIVVPKNDNRSDMRLHNLKYVIKQEYDLRGTTKEMLMQLIPFFKNKSDDEIARLLSVSRGWVNKVRTELKEKGKIGKKALNGIIISRSTYDIYLALLECKGSKSNLDIAKELRPDANFEDKEEQGRLTDKVSRVRKKLYARGLIKKYNTYQKKVNIADVREALELTLIANREMSKGERKTHAEIAEVFGLSKDQVDNFSRQIKR